MRKFLNSLFFLICFLITLIGIEGLLGGYGVMIMLGSLGMIAAVLDNAKQANIVRRIETAGPPRIEPSLGR